jgi:catechol 2,3-dioxygenase-like lactoylglutathione lyase family enzyme
MSGYQVRAVLHPVVITGEMKGALAFYRDLLGLTVKNEMVHDAAKLAELGGPRNAVASAAVLIAADGSEIELACFDEPRGKPRTDAGWPDAGIRSITFVVDDLQGLLARLSAAGHPPAGAVVSFHIEGNAVRVAYVDGPDGVVLTFLERVAP